MSSTPEVTATVMGQIVEPVRSSIQDVVLKLDLPLVAGLASGVLPPRSSDPHAANTVYETERMFRATVMNEYDRGRLVRPSKERATEIIVEIRAFARHADRMAEAGRRGQLAARVVLHQSGELIDPVVQDGLDFAERRKAAAAEGKILERLRVVK